MSVNCCPTCGRKFTATKPKPTEPTADTATMSNAAMFAHYKRTAPLEDVRFMLRVARMSDGLRAGFEALELAIQQTNPTRAAIYREYGQLQAAWRAESNARDRAVRDQHLLTCPSRSNFNAPCDCGRASLPDTARPATVTRLMVDRILAAYMPPAVRGLLCA
jgi:hypothetical protein